MDNWADIWERKGKTITTDLKELDGYEGTDINAKKIVFNIMVELKVKPKNTLLEVGCGAGALSEEFRKYAIFYYGCDKCQAMLDRQKPHHMTRCEANDLPYESKIFDYVVCYSVFQYFPNYKYAYSVIREMERVAKKAIFIGDLVEASCRDSHLMFNRNDPIFKWWNMSEGYYNPDRFNVWREV